MATNPYKNLPAAQLWAKAMLDPAPGQINPSSPTFKIEHSEQIASMGSCFAQHIARHIRHSGMSYLETEPGSVEQGFGLFSARYGNVYTPRQALQLFQRAFDLRPFDEHTWQNPEGLYFDAFRTAATPDGFVDKHSLLVDRRKHLTAVRSVFEKADWMVFTLGLTEAWQSRVDGAVFPLAPGVKAGSFDPAAHQFINFSISEVMDDLHLLIDSVKKVNGKLRWILTVSPVALLATYEARHVLTSSVASKSILRAAADDMTRRQSHVYYFPSFEIINSPANQGRYLDDDLRSVTHTGVRHVMRVFSTHFQGTAKTTAALSTKDSAPPESPVICDEDLIADSLKQAGFQTD